MKLLRRVVLYRRIYATKRLLLDLVYTLKNVCVEGDGVSGIYNFSNICHAARGKCRREQNTFSYI